MSTNHTTAMSNTTDLIHSDVNSSNFLRFWTGQTVAVFGMRLSMVAMPVIAVQLLHASENQVGFINACSTVAFLVLCLPAGAWVDRWLKRPTMMGANLVRCLTALSIPILYLAGQLQVWHLCIAALIIGFATVFFDVAYQSYLPILVPSNQIGDANSRLESTAQLAMTAGPALGGLLLKAISAPLLMLGTSVGYLVSFIATGLTKDTELTERKPSPKNHMWQEVKEGFTYSWHNLVIRQIIYGNTISSVGFTMIQVLLPILVLRSLEINEFYYGLILTAGSAGGLLGALVTSYLKHFFSDGFLIPVSLTISCAANLFLPAAAYAPNQSISIALLMVGSAISAFFSLVYNILQVSVRQRLCPRDLLGRMNASIRWVVWGLWAPISLLAGWMGTVLGILPTMWIGGILSLFAGLSQIHMGAAIKECETQMELEHI